MILLEDAATQCPPAPRGWPATRGNTPRPAEPLVVVLVDELAVLTAYLPDRELTRRAEAALNIVLSRGGRSGT